ncbi:DUF420 domain-containing protein [Leptospira sp. GIMC2001]|uniref:DUF420 domain-containing protein n=1 Tax=Leptospira sp. GIMC2001 TaxID=1513297 RepID=UPI00234B14E6|nr:DUF420 domain-containing protein [Leptospira sp. GIMC2001]WCL49862.1 DUF420 domain-containing protein [Leptospira sp. GIMC2001]
MSLYLIHFGMTLSVICFAIGYYFRKSDNRIHRIFNSIGVLFNLSTAVYLLVMKYLMGGIEENGIVPNVDPWIILTHRIFAATALIMMLVMAYTGMTRKSEIHKRIHIFFIPLYLVVYISGLVIFKYVGE